MPLPGQLLLEELTDQPRAVLLQANAGEVRAPEFMEVFQGQPHN